MPGTNRLRALLALLAAGVALSGCGSDELSGEIPPDDAAELNSSLDAVSAAIAVQDCDGASEAVQEYGDLVDQLPATAGEELKAALRNAGVNLGTLVSDQCVSEPTDTTSTDTTETSTSSAPTTTTTSTTDTSTSTTTTSSTTTAEPPDDGSGGPGGGDGGGQSGGDGGTGGTGGGTGDESGG